MSVHTRAAILASHRFTLTVCIYHGGCAQYFEFEGLTEGQVEAKKKYYRASSPGVELAFDVQSI
jgi:hypothetical protein